MSDIKSILTRNDKILIAALVTAALLSALPVLNAAAHGGSGARAVIAVAGRRQATVSLSINKTLSVRTKSGEELLQVSDGRIRVTDAPCPRQICRHSGWISRTGEELICVPGEMVVRIEGGGKPAVDAVSR
jgi:hypothetical protein